MDLIANGVIAAKIAEMVALQVPQAIEVDRNWERGEWGEQEEDSLPETPDTAEKLLAQAIEVWGEQDEVECPCCGGKNDGGSEGGEHEAWCWFLRARKFLDERGLKVTQLI